MGTEAVSLPSKHPPRCPGRQQPHPSYVTGWQAVLERPVPEVAALPVRELRLPLLAPSELVTLESHNQRDLLIPVSCCLFLGCPG